jgi:cell division protease FtsH
MTSSSLVFSKEDEEREAWGRFLKDNNFDYEIDVDGNETDVRKVQEEEEGDLPSYFPKKGRRKRQVQAPLLILRLTQEDPQPSIQSQLARSLFRRGRDEDDDEEEEEKPRTKRKSENFEVVYKPAMTFADIGGCDLIKKELLQCTDILLNYSKYAAYNVRVPKGIILEGPPGNGKTLLAKGFAGEAKTAFIPVSGAQFQDKYVGVGSTRVRELFALAKENIPCIIFIDEIDAVGRSRSSDGEAAGSERDNTLNELLIGLDGFSTAAGIFLMGATNRVDLLDPALTRPGRIDKKIFIGPPDAAGREAILKINLKGKPYNESTVSIKDLVAMTDGYSGAEIENLLNEAMLTALRSDRFQMELEDLEQVATRMMVGWQPYDHQFTPDLLDRIAVHEMGHAILGMFAKHHARMTKVVINLSSPTSPGYTVFEPAGNTIMKREALLEHLQILLAGRIAEEVFYGASTTTGAHSDFQEAYQLAHKMVVHYGMGSKPIMPHGSERFKERIDQEIASLLHQAYDQARHTLEKAKDLAREGADILLEDKVLRVDRLSQMIDRKYPYLRLEA